MKILLVEDDPDLQKIIAAFLINAGYQVKCASDGEEALSYFYEEIFALAILDWMLPYINGIQLIQKMQQELPIKILMLTSKNQAQDEVNAFKAGADDYLAKPFHAKVLLMRVAKLLGVLTTKNKRIMISSQKNAALVDNHPISLTKTEFELLLFFVRNEGSVLSREQLSLAVYGWGDHDEKNLRTIDSYVRLLRKKLPKEVIKTVHGVGYRFENF
ncbi:MAG: response regulator transcription factor [Lactobacillales bacterium]|jgi:DNA-binding response OmpR family regulator|nr:response regulator transcription factor [Lactobacillales bacterium]